VIQLTMRTNQKYFALNDAAGALAPAFLCTANIEAADGGALIVAGNQKVLAARLSDARFFWQQDLKTPLAEQAKKLDQIVFHEKLGTVADKVERVAKLARWLVEEGIILPGTGRGTAEGGGGGSPQAPHPAESPLHHPADGPPPRAGEELATLAETAARLCKADLVTGMVGEFPELQGVMGGYYARAEGLPDAVADAIRDHYKPVGQGDDVPTAPVTVAVSLADKLDSLAQFFLIGEMPTGSKDPFALRRSALGIISLILGNELRFRLERVLLQACGEDLGKFEAVFFDRIEERLANFFADRLKVQQREAGVRHDLIDAVFALGGEDDLVRLLARVKALQSFVATEDGANLLAGYKRAANILRIEEKKDADLTPLPAREGLGVGGEPTGSPSAAAVGRDPAGRAPTPVPSLAGRGEGAETALATALDTAEPAAAAAVEAEDFEGAMRALALLRAPIDAFFEQVIVNDPDPATRLARLALLRRIRDAVHRVADFSRIEG